MAVLLSRCQTGGVDIEAVIEALGGRYDADESAVIDGCCGSTAGRFPISN